MENEKLFGFIRRRGTLGVLTLVLVGIVAFASYRTSYPVTTETEQTEEVKEASRNRCTAEEGAESHCRNIRIRRRIKIKKHQQQKA